MFTRSRALFLYVRMCLRHMYSPRGATSTDAAARCAALSVESTKPVGATAKRPESASGLRGVGGGGKRGPGFATQNGFTQILLKNLD